MRARAPSLWDDHQRAADVAGPQLRESLVRSLERERLDLRSHRHARGEREELVSVLPRQVRDRSENALAPEQVVRERRNVAHVDPGADDDATLGDRTERRRDELTRGGED